MGKYLVYSTVLSDIDLIFGKVHVVVINTIRVCILQNLNYRRCLDVFSTKFSRRNTRLRLSVVLRWTPNKTQELETNILLRKGKLNCGALCSSTLCISRVQSWMQYRFMRPWNYIKMLDLLKRQITIVKLNSGLLSAGVLTYF